MSFNSYVNYRFSNNNEKRCVIILRNTPILTLHCIGYACLYTKFTSHTFMVGIARYNLLELSVVLLVFLCIPGEFSKHNSKS